MRTLFLTILTCGVAAMTAGTAQAQAGPPDDGSPHGVVAIGPGVVPEFDGSGDMRVFPFVVADVQWRGINVQVGGPGLRMDVVPDPRLAFGPVIGMRLPRNDVDGPVGLLPNIGTAIEAGAFVGYRIGGSASGQGSLQIELSVVHDVSQTHNGLLATASASYAAVRQRDFFLSLGAQTTWVNQDYARTYFGIDAAGARASGLPAYRPDAGVRDIGGGVTAGYWFSDHLGVTARAGASYLVGDIADSPITDNGSRWQPAAGVMLSYRF
ncbi:MipA/OmpV family protein [Sphingobium sp. Sx8-8]|uniref:MipA/OmpV family protein n=1 Tax=Sphingobium sp. Sx8-8 TaxID=2933617 RepID=UPI001F574C5E|nr:MipA/OmpV family protein [Sphingobium sp. Sx8-8]